MNSLIEKESNRIFILGKKKASPKNVLIFSRNLQENIKMKVLKIIHEYLENNSFIENGKTLKLAEKFNPERIINTNS